MKNTYIKILTENMDNRNLLMKVTLCNFDVIPYFISRDILSLDGIYDINFNIISGPKHIKTTIRHTENGSTKFDMLKSQECIANIFDLKIVFDFDSAIPGVYEVQYSVYDLFCRKEEYKDCVMGLTLTNSTQFEVESS